MKWKVCHYVWDGFLFLSLVFLNTRLENHISERLMCHQSNSESKWTGFSIKESKQTWEAQYHHTKACTVFWLSLQCYFLTVMLLHFLFQRQSHQTTSCTQSQCVDWETLSIPEYLHKQTQPQYHKFTIRSSEQTRVSHLNVPGSEWQHCWTLRYLKRSITVQPSYSALSLSWQHNISENIYIKTFKL